jgi:hypothetical protein
MLELLRIDLMESFLAAFFVSYFPSYNWYFLFLKTFEEQILVTVE